MAIRIGKLFGTDKLVGTDDDNLLIALGAKTTLIGGLGNDILLGGLNNDILIGGKGADFLSGGLGTDTADYSGSDSGVTVNLTTGEGHGGDAEGDTIVLVENLIGSAFDDVLTGDKGNNVLTGGDGDDIFVVTKGKDVITDFTPSTGTSDTVVLIDFDSPAATPGIQIGLSNGDFGLDWLSFHFANPIAGGSLATLQDYVGDQVAYTSIGSSFGQPATGYFSSSTGDFNLLSMDIGLAAGGSGLKVRIDAYDDDAVVGSFTLDVASSRVAIDFESGEVDGGAAAFTGYFTSIDKVLLDPLGSWNVAVDDIRLAYPGAAADGGDKIDVADGTDIAALVAGAASNGKGGTMLTHAQGKLELLGVDSGSVSADWFA